MAEQEAIVVSRWAGILLVVAGALAGLSAVGVVLAGVWPMPRGESGMQVAQRLDAVDQQRADAATLAGEISGRKLLEPAEVQAAVRDSGLAEEMLGKLRLNAIVKVRGKSKAYIMVEEQGVKLVEQGDKVLEFEVQEIGDDHVELTLQGVRVMLKN